jgi:hypothetical protein
VEENRGKERENPLREPNTSVTFRIPWPPVFDGAREVSLILEGLDHSGPSCEVRVFLNNPKAGPSTPPSESEGYVGSVSIYGYDLPGADRSSDGSLPARAPMTRQLSIDGNILHKIGSAASLLVTLVPLYFADEQRSAEREFAVSGVRLAIKSE